MKLGDHQLKRLAEEYSKFIESLELPRVKETQQERSFTQKVVYPKLLEWVESLEIPQLIVRSDGIRTPRQINKFGMTFIPDLEVTHLSQKCIAVEVKLLRSTDPSGSLAKAVGQAKLYRELGFEISSAIIVDARRRNYQGLNQFGNSFSDFENRIISKLYE